MGNDPINFVDPTGHIPAKGAFNAGGDGAGCSPSKCQDIKWIFEGADAAAVVDGACRTGLETDFDYCVASYYALKSFGYNVPASLSKAYPIFFNRDAVALAYAVQSATEAMSNMATQMALAGGTSPASFTATSLPGLSFKVTLGDIFANPKILVGMTPAQVEALAREAGWSVGPLNNGRNVGGGLAVRGGGDKAIFFNPGGGHHGDSAYWKVSSGVGGTVRVPLDPYSFKP